MNKEFNSELISDFEIILPWDVIETCYNLKQNESSCFVSENFISQTNNQLYISKLDDNSIKVRITVTSLKPAIDISILKTKEKTEKTTELSNIDNDGNNENLSTIIIVKSSSPKHLECSDQTNYDGCNSNMQTHLNKMEEYSTISSSVKYKKDKPFSSKYIKNTPALYVRKESQCVVQCELCGDAVVGYGPLYKHVRWAHGEGTFVQNYLDELRPLVKSWAVEQHKKSQYRQKEFFSSLDFIDSSEIKSKKKEKVVESLNKKSKKSNILNQDKQAIKTFPKIFYCKICGASFFSADMQIIHEEKCIKDHKFICDFCVPKKKFISRKNMLKHVAEVHIGKRATPHMLQGTHISKIFGKRKIKNMKKSNILIHEIFQNTNAARKSIINSHICDLCQEEFASLNLLICHSKYCRSFPLT